MTTQTITINTEKTNTSTSENKIEIGIYNNADELLEVSVKHPESASQSTISSQGYFCILNETQREDIKQYVLNN